ncbi:MAG: VWA domain-containing protein [Deltaproteobacteria bacterium]|nr:VWA domain-containing protein [Deltaproteobacteria bacterium]
MGLQYSIYYLFSAQSGGTVLQQHHPVLFEDSVPVPGNNSARWNWSNPTVLIGNFAVGTTFTSNDGIFVDNNNDGIDDNEQGQYNELVCTISDWKASGGASIQGRLQFLLTDSTNPGHTATREIDIHLRVIDFTNFNVYKNQTGSDPLLADDGIIFSLTSPVNSISEHLNLAFTNLGSVTATYDPAYFSWPSAGTSSGTFQLVITESAGAKSIIDGLHLHLKPMMDFSEINIFQGQTGTDPVVPDEGFTYSFAVSNSSFPAGLTISMSPLGVVTATTTGSFTWPVGTSNGAIDFSIYEAGHPKSLFAGTSVSLRRLASTPIRISHAGSGVLSVADAAGEQWQFEMTEDLPVTVCTINNGAADNQATIGTVAIEYGEYGTASVTAQHMNAGSALAPKCFMNVPVSVDMGLAAQGGGTTLPAGRERMRYIAQLVVDSWVGAGDSVLVEFSYPGSLPSIAAAMEFLQDGGSALNWTLQTKVLGTGDVLYIPEGTNGGNEIRVVAKKFNSGTLVAQSEVVPFSMNVSETKENVNATILLDRSGSMNWENRWEAAASGAGAFADMVQGTANSDKYKLGVYWFASGGPATDVLGAYELGNGNAKSDGTAVETTCLGVAPNGNTSLGKGLLLCRDRLTDIGDSEAERVILTLTDGMENMPPATSAVFHNSGLGADYWFNGGDPEVRIYPMALMSGGSAWVDGLKDIVHDTGGIPEVDFTEIVSWSGGPKAAPILIHNWFNNIFMGLYGYSAGMMTPDPILSKGQSVTEPVQIHSGQSQVVFYLNHDDPTPSNWRVEVLLPQKAGTINKEIAMRTEGIRFAETSYSTMITVNYPLHISGAEHCWSGQWQLKVTRTGTGKGGYAVGALVKEDMKFRVDLVSKGKAAPGNRVWVRASLNDESGKAITNARMTGLITQPPSWAGDKLALLCKRSIQQYDKLTKEKNPVLADIENPTDKYISQLANRLKPVPGAAKRIVLKHMGKGEYVGSFIPDSPGEYRVDVTCTGVRMAKPTEITKRKNELAKVLTKTVTVATQKYTDEFNAKARAAAKLQKVVQSASRSKRSRTVPGKVSIAKSVNTLVAVPQLSATAIRKFEQTYQTKAVQALITALRREQRYTLEYRGSWNVPFIPSAKHSVVFGYMEDKNTICMHVEPKDNSAHLLGPGFADRIFFTTPAGRNHRWPAKDMLDGTYEVEIPFKAGAARLDVKRTCLVSTSITLKHPTCKTLVRLKRDEICLKDFAVTVMDVTMPVTIFAMAGNTKTKLVHLLNCKKLDKLNDADLIWFEDIKDVTKHQYIPCPQCMMLPVQKPIKPSGPVVPSKPVKPRKPVREAPLRKPAKKMVKQSVAKPVRRPVGRRITKK